MRLGVSRRGGRAESKRAMAFPPAQGRVWDERRSVVIARTKEVDPVIRDLVDKSVFDVDPA